MFGYVRAFKPQMRMCEYDTYKAFYCGLCKRIKKDYGFIATLTLSYDFAFLSIMNAAINDCDAKAEKCRCIAHPLKKTICVKCDSGLAYPAAAAEILIYHKLRDDCADKGFFKKLIAKLMLLFLKRGYKKASKLYPSLAEEIEIQMKQQAALEAKPDCSIDMAAEPSAKMMQAIAYHISDDNNTCRALERFGYFLGRYIYICDAADDLIDDLKSGNFNPLIKEFDLEGDLDEEQKAKISEFVKGSVNMTLGELANCYTLLELKKFKPILDNVIYLGLKNSCQQIIDNRFCDKKGNEQ